MLPTFRHDQVVVGTTDTTKVGVGDVVVVEHEGLEKIKRVADVQGDRIYVLGDNPAASSDSRVFGWLESKLVRAKIIWPKRDHRHKKRD
jgi:phage repressor protein C with HTH and peptisase S24 domain